jgi:YjbE family integral membrane protein
MTTTTFLLALLQIVWIDVLLSGDNAVVIALACRNLGSNKNLGMMLGAGAAVLLRILCTGIVAWLMNLPVLKIVGACALIWVAVKMLAGEDEADHPPSGHEALFWAVLTVVGADAMMSLDNVVAVAAIAKDNLWLLVIGLAMSIPFVVLGAKLISGFIDRYPVLKWAGSAILGWIAGGMFIHDAVLPVYYTEGLETFAPLTGAIAVLLFGWMAPNLENSDA